ncbi:unnamed protein product [Sphagnum tenellum]
MGSAVATRHHGTRRTLLASDKPPLRFHKQRRSRPCDGNHRHGCRVWKWEVDRIRVPGWQADQRCEAARFEEGSCGPARWRRYHVLGGKGDITGV